MQSCLTHPRGNQIHKEIFYNDANLRNNEDEIMNNNEDVTSEEKSLNKKNQISSKMKKVIESNVQNKDENQIKNKNEVSRGNKRLKKNINLDIHQEDFPFQRFQVPKSLEGEVIKPLLKI